MATGVAMFPGTQDNESNTLPTVDTHTDRLNSGGNRNHDQIHDNLQAIIKAIEAKVGYSSAAPQDQPPGGNAVYVSDAVGNSKWGSPGSAVPPGGLTNQVLQAVTSSNPIWTGTPTVNSLTTTAGLTVGTNASVGGTLGVTGAATLNSTVAVTGAATLSSTLHVVGAVTLDTTLTVANGGTGRATLTNHALLLGAATTAITQLAAGAQATVLNQVTASADPAWSATPVFKGFTMFSVALGGGQGWIGVDDSSGKVQFTGLLNDIYLGGTGVGTTTTAVKVDGITGLITSPAGLTNTTGPISLTDANNENVVTVLPTHATLTGTAFKVSTTRAASTAFNLIDLQANAVSKFKIDGTGIVTLGLAASQVIPGVTSFAIRNNANSADNLILTDAGAATFRNTVNIATAGAVNGINITQSSANTAKGAIDSTGAGNGFGAWWSYISKTTGGTTNTWSVGTNITTAVNAYQFYDDTNLVLSLAHGGGVTIPSGGLQVTAGNIGVGGAPSSVIGLDTRSLQQAIANDTHVGVYGYAYGSSGTGGSSTNLYGTIGGVRWNVSGQTLTNGVGMEIDNAVVDAGSITNQYGLLVSSQTHGTATNYGVYINTPSGGSTTNRAIYVDGASVEAAQTSGAAQATTFADWQYIASEKTYVNGKLFGGLAWRVLSGSNSSTAPQMGIYGQMGNGVTNKMFFGTSTDNGLSGLNRTVITLQDGLIVGAPTGGDKGAGTANFAGDIYKNNAVYTNPDYVFEHFYTGRIVKYVDKLGAKDYKGLQTLADLEAYISEHYCFPGFGQDSGVGLFEGSENLLLITEQLALHLIEADKRLKAVEAQLAA